MTVGGVVCVLLSVTALWLPTVNTSGVVERDHATQ